MRLPRTPSQKIVTLARMSTPGSNVGFRSPFLSIPRSPVRTPTTASPSKSSSAAGETGENVDALRLDQPAEPLHEPVERDDVVAVVLERRRRDRKRHLPPGSGSTRHRGALRRQAARPSPRSQASAHAGRGSSTAPDSTCAPGSRAFSRTAMASGSPPRSFCSWASRSAADIPAGPPPTMRMSTSSVSRSTQVPAIGLRAAKLRVR